MAEMRGPLTIEFGGGLRIPRPFQCDYTELVSAISLDGVAPNSGQSMHDENHVGNDRSQGAADVARRRNRSEEIYKRALKDR